MSSAKYKLAQFEGPDISVNRRIALQLTNQPRW